MLAGSNFTAHIYQAAEMMYMLKIMILFWSLQLINLIKYASLYESTASDSGGH